MSGRRQRCCPASSLTCLLVLCRRRCRRPLVRVPRFTSPTTRSSYPLLAPAPLLRPPSSLGLQPALLPPLPSRLSLSRPPCPPPLPARLSPPLRLTARLSPLLDPTPLIYPPSSFGLQPALLLPLLARLPLCLVPPCCCCPRRPCYIPLCLAPPVVVQRQLKKKKSENKK